jgi:hypothetical protein
VDKQGGGGGRYHTGRLGEEGGRGGPPHRLPGWGRSRSSAGGGCAPCDSATDALAPTTAAETKEADGRARQMYNFPDLVGDYFYSIVLAKTDFKIIVLTGHPNNKF